MLAVWLPPKCLKLIWTLAFLGSFTFKKDMYSLLDGMKFKCTFKLISGCNSASVQLSKEVPGGGKQPAALTDAAATLNQAVL